MSYFIRFFGRGNAPTIDALSGLLRAASPDLSLQSATEPMRALIVRDGGDAALPYAEIDVNLPGDDLFEPEIEEFLEWAHSERMHETVVRARDDVVSALGATEFIIAVRYLWMGRSSDEVLDAVDPLWTVLKSGWSGIVHASGEGFYRGHDLILELPTNK